MAGKDAARWHGNRVELNAMTAPQFVEFVHGKPTAAGVRKIIPDESTLQMAWNAAKRRRIIEADIRDAMATTEGQEFPMPADLRERLKARIEGQAIPWDDALTTTPPIRDSTARGDNTDMAREPS